LEPKTGAVLKITSEGDQFVEAELRDSGSLGQEAEGRMESIARTGSKSRWLLEAYGRHGGKSTF
jgi:hypothetical protein